MGLGGGGFNYGEVPEFTILQIHKMFKYACIILLFLFKGEKRKRSHIGNISNYLWEKESCLNELGNTDDSEIINLAI